MVASSVRTGLQDVGLVYPSFQSVPLLPEALSVSLKGLLGSSGGPLGAAAVWDVLVNGRILLSLVRPIGVRDVWGVPGLWIGLPFLPIVSLLPEPLPMPPVGLIGSSRGPVSVFREDNRLGSSLRSVLQILLPMGISSVTDPLLPPPPSTLSIPFLCLLWLL